MGVGSSSSEVPGGGTEGYHVLRVSMLTIVSFISGTYMDFGLYHGHEDVLFCTIKIINTMHIGMPVEERIFHKKITDKTVNGQQLPSNLPYNQ